MCLLLTQVIDEADRMIDSMHQSWLSQVMGAVYRSRAEPGSVFRRTEAACITSARCVCVYVCVIYCGVIEMMSVSFLATNSGQQKKSLKVTVK